jgi:hypothetical protein
MIAWGLFNPAGAGSIKRHRPSLPWTHKPFSSRAVPLGVSGAGDLQRGAEGVEKLLAGNTAEWSDDAPYSTPLGMINLSSSKMLDILRANKWALRNTPGR